MAANRIPEYSRVISPYIDLGIITKYKEHKGKTYAYFIKSEGGVLKARGYWMKYDGFVLDTPENRAEAHDYLQNILDVIMCKR